MYEKVLIPLDGSELAECSLDHLRNLSQGDKIGEAILLHVLDPIMWCREGCDFIAVRNSQFRQAEKYIDGIKSRLGSEGINARAEILERGIVASSIVEYAKENAVDLIIISKNLYFFTVVSSALAQAVFGFCFQRPARNSTWSSAVFPVVSSDFSHSASSSRISRPKTFCQGRISSLDKRTKALTFPTPK